MFTMVAIIHLISPDSQRLQHKQSGQNLDGRHWNERSNAHDDGSRWFWILKLFFLFLCTLSWGHFQTNRVIFGSFSDPNLLPTDNLTPIYYQLSSWLLSKGCRRLSGGTEFPCCRSKTAHNSLSTGCSVAWLSPSFFGGALAHGMCRHDVVPSIPQRPLIQTRGGTDELRNACEFQR